ncbi:hypothetical protein J3459_010518 [Metarhizium acridum]|nr:hypothetical protein J3459_010623 [Metarhizium acridum]KAG8422280.1 hypothetical protein J3459_010518 [Metarhizium acridum]
MVVDLIRDCAVKLRLAIHHHQPAWHMQMLLVFRSSKGFFYILANQGEYTLHAAFSSYETRYTARPQGVIDLRNSQLCASLIELNCRDILLSSSAEYPSRRDSSIG